MILPKESAENILIKIRLEAYDSVRDEWLRYDGLDQDDNVVEREKILKKQTEYFLSLYNQLPTDHKEDIKFWISKDKDFAETWSLYTLDFKFEENNPE